MYRVCSSVGVGGAGGGGTGAGAGAGAGTTTAGGEAGSVSCLVTVSCCGVAAVIIITKPASVTEQLL
jgi:hypothetical protein